MHTHTTNDNLIDTDHRRYITSFSVTKYTAASNYVQFIVKFSVYRWQQIEIKSLFIIKYIDKY